MGPRARDPWGHRQLEETGAPWGLQREPSPTSWSPGSPPEPLLPGTQGGADLFQQQGGPTSGPHQTPGTSRARYHFRCSVSGCLEPRLSVAEQDSGLNSILMTVPPLTGGNQGRK